MFKKICFSQHKKGYGCKQMWFGLWCLTPLSKKYFNYPGISWGLNKYERLPNIIRTQNTVKEHLFLLICFLCIRKDMDVCMVFNVTKRSIFFIDLFSQCRKDIDVNTHQILPNITLMAQIKVEEQRFYSSTFLLRAKMLCFLLHVTSVSSLLLQQNHLIMYTIYKCTKNQIFGQCSVRIYLQLFVGRYMPFCVNCVCLFPTYIMLCF